MGRVWINENQAHFFRLKTLQIVFVAMPGLIF